MESLEVLVKQAECDCYNMSTLGKHSDYMNLLFQIMEVDMDVGVALWKDIIINYRFENRSQDFTYIALESFIHKFGFEKILALFKKDKDLEKLLFCESREISELFFELLIKFSTPKVLKYYLSLLTMNTTDKMLKESQKRRKYLANQYSRLRASAGGFRLEHFIEHFSYKIDFIIKHSPAQETDKSVVVYKEWERTACEKWKRFNDSFNDDYYTPNLYMPEYKDISIDWRKLQPEVQNSLQTFPELQKFSDKIIYPVIDEHDSLSNITVAKNIFCFLLKKYKTFFIAPDVGGKKSSIMQFIAQNCSASFRFSSFFPSDESSFTLCCFSESERDCALYEIQQQCIYAKKDDTSANEIILGGVGLSHYFRYLKWYKASGEYSQIAGMFPAFYKSDTTGKRTEQIQYWVDFIGKDSFLNIMKAIVSDLLPLLNEVYDTQRNYSPRFSRDQLKNGQESLTKVMIDSGFFKSRWINEQKLYQLVCISFPDAMYQYHPSWLGQQSLDIYIPSLKVGIEYQGRQHYEVFEFWGGESGLKKRQELDERKRRLCNENSVRLFEWLYTTPVDKPHVMKFIRDNLTA